MGLFDFFKKKPVEETPVVEEVVEATETTKEEN